MIYKFSMNSGRQSPTNRTYLISITAAQSVAGTCSRLQNLLHDYGLTSFPFPPGIAVLQINRDPGPPVPGRLPACDTPLVMAGHLAAEDWITWPVESSAWLEKLTEALTEHAGGASVTGKHEQLSIPRFCIPLARVSGRERIPDLTSAEVGSILKNIPGWRSINLVCWNIEYLAARPWYKSTAWYPLWQRRLKRAPLSTNINKTAYLD